MNSVQNVNPGHYSAWRDEVAVTSGKFWQPGLETVASVAALEGTVIDLHLYCERRL